MYKQHLKLTPLLISIISILYFTGCASHMTVTQKELPEPNYLLAHEIKTSLLENESKIRTIKGNAAIEAKCASMQSAFRLNSIIRFKRPDIMRMITNKLSFTIFDLTFNGKNLWFYVPSEKKVFTGAIDETTKINRFGLSFKPYDIFNIFFNYNGLFKDNDFFLETDNGLLVMRIVDPLKGSKHLLANLYIDQSYNVLKYEMFDDNKSVKTLITFKYYTELEGCKLPKVIEIMWPQDNAFLNLTFRSFTVNQTLSDEIFKFSLPDHTEVVPLTTGIDQTSM